MEIFMFIQPLLYHMLGTVLGVVGIALLISIPLFVGIRSGWTERNNGFMDKRTHMYENNNGERSSPLKGVDEGIEDKDEGWRFD